MGKGNVGVYVRTHYPRTEFTVRANCLRFLYLFAFCIGGFGEEGMMCGKGKDC